jgi:hypothetical protein
MKKLRACSFLGTAESGDVGAIYMEQKNRIRD